ncbi:MAG: M16 family metallopeptidase [Marinifilaceae bacterium]
MNKQVMLFRILLVGVFVALSAQLFAKTVKRDSSILHGKLSNGLTYYIVNNDDGSKRVNYSLTLKAGAMDEDDSQRGLAHFNEHLSFDGTPTFPFFLADGKFVNNVDPRNVYLNALTTKTETVYTIMLPETRETLMDTAMIIMSEWLMSDFCADTNINKQRSIIAKEWLEFQDAQERMRMQWHPVLFNNSKWGYRRSIGEIDVIDNAPKSEIKRFRDEWYRPDLAAVTVVGNVDPQLVLNKLEKNFLAFPDNKVYREKEVVAIPDNDKLNIIVTADKDQQYSFISMYNRRPLPELYTTEGIKRDLLYAMINGIASERYSDCQEKNNEVISLMSATISSIMEPQNLYSPMVTFNRGEIKNALVIHAREQERIVQNGYLDSEFASIKSLLTNKYKQALEHGHQLNNQQWVSTIERDFLKSTSAITSAASAKLYLPVLEKITKQDVEAMQRELWAEPNSMMLIIVPEADLNTVPSKEEIVSILNTVKNEKLEQYQKTELSADIIEMKKMPKAGKIVKREQVTDKMPVHKLTLSNGARVVYYQDSSKYGTIHFEAVSFGGKSLLNEREAVLADLLCSVINEGPVGNYSLNQFRRIMGRDRMQFTVSIANDTESVKGNTPVSRFELLLQRIYTLFNNQELTPERYNGIFKQRADFFNASRMSTEETYKNFLNNARAGKKADDYVATDDVELQELESILKKRFHSMSDFTFYFTGAMHEAEFEKLITQYLGSGKKGKRENYKATSINTLSGTTNVTFKRGQDPRANVTYVIGAPVVTDMNNMSILQMATPMLNKRFYNHIRETLHMVYSLSTDLKFQVTQTPRADIEVTFQGDPKDLDTIYSEINRLFEEFIKEGPTEEELNEYKSMMTGSKLRYQNEDGFRMGCIRSHDLYYNNDYEQQVNNITFIQNITVKQIQQLLSEIYNHPKALKAGFAQIAE